MNSKDNEDKFNCDTCGKKDCEVLSCFKNKIWICKDCMNDLYDMFKTHYMVKRTSNVCKMIEDKIKEI